MGGNFSVSLCFETLEISQRRSRVSTSGAGAGGDLPYHGRDDDVTGSNENTGSAGGFRSFSQGKGKEEVGFFILK